ncbi:MAG: hypothetical protein K6D56_00820 [Clostridia bacterium]|nr:hypothetical protein [Clostridia bacterium]
MSRVDFVKETILDLRSEYFESLRDALIPEYLTFSVLQGSQVTKELLAEKAIDYFEKIELKTGKDFDKQVETYMDNLDQVVERRVARAPKPNKRDNKPIETPRARKFYDRAKSIEDLRVKTTEQLVDYTRIMTCLYMSFLNDKVKYISDFNYSKECLDIKAIIDSLKKEQEASTLGLTKKYKFDLKDLYCLDTCTFILTIIILHTIMNR